MKQYDTVILETPCVTGTKDKHDTPIGLYQVLDKVTDTYLDGNNDNGTKYHCHVEYWMPFYEGYGIHDANWRYSFGDNIYTYSGSHGCVNIPSDVAEQVYDYVEVGTFVYVH